MTTIRQIITDSYREGGLIQIGTSPSAEQLDEGLRKLQSIVSELLGHEAGEGFQTVAYGTGVDTNNYARDIDRKDYLDSYYIPSNVRLLVSGSSAQTVYLNPNPQPGARFTVVDVSGSFATGNFTIKGNGRKIDGGTEVVLSVDGTNDQWFYREDLAEWVKVTNIDVDDESPFPFEFDEFLIISLVMRLNPRYGEQTAPETLQTWRRVKSQFRARYKQTELVPSDVTRLFWNGFVTLNPTTAFSRGLIVG